jgi:hypothetical protein
LEELYLGDYVTCGDLMIDLEQTVSSAKPESSLLMSYCASLSFFERDLLPYLQQAGVGSVTVLLDEAEYNATFSDLTQSVGIRYKLHPIRLPNPAANFHPKLYLLNAPETATLLVASANLTPSGFRSNLEVVDQLTLSPTHLDDASAFGQYVQMLRILPTLDKRLPESLVKELASIATRLEKRGATAQSTDRGPWFLHTLVESLMPQLVRLVPPKEVTTITAISPFFDENSTAILELAKAYPNANIRVITNPDSGALNGLPLTKLGNRIKVDELSPQADPKRRLHAKLLILSGVKRDCVVSGSANLTRAAWLASAQSSNCGNVEAVIVRAVEHSISTARLLAELKTRPVDYRTLTRDPLPPKTEPDGAPRLILIDAEFRNEHVAIGIDRGSWYHRKVSFRVLTDQGGRRAEFTPALREDGSQLRLRIHLGHRGVSDTPIALTVFAYLAGGIVLQARTWVAVPGMLAMNSSQRHVRADVRDVCRAAFGRDEDASAISEAFNQFLTELGELSHHRTREMQTSEPKQVTNDEMDNTISAEDFIVSDNVLGSLRASHNRLVQAFNGLALLLHKLILDATDTEDEEAPLDHESEDDEDSDLKQKKKATANHQPTARKAAALLAQINEEIGSSIDQSLGQPVSERYLPFILSIPQAAIAYIRFHSKLSQQLKMNLGHGLAFTIRDILKRVFSVDGVLGGGSFGWLVRAWASDKCKAALREQLTDAKRVEDLRVFVAAGLAVDGPVKSNDRVAYSVLAGLHLVTGEDPRTDAQAAMEQRLEGTGIASVGAISAAQMEDSLHSYDPVKLALLPIIRFWSALSEIDERHDTQPTPQVLSDMEAAAPGVWQEYLDLKERLPNPLTRVYVNGSGMSCCSCRRVLPTNISMHFPPSEIEKVHCDYCHRLIVPLAAADTTVERVRCWLNSLPERRANG